MIVYFESSAFTKLFLKEAGSEAARDLWTAATEVMTVRLTYPEVRAALAAARRAERLDTPALNRAKREFERRFADTFVADVTDDMARLGGELAERWGLRAYDAVHLSAAGLARAGGSLTFVTWDRALAEAARGERLMTAGV